MKRFYSKVTVAGKDGAYHIHLDGKPVRTPSGQYLDIPEESLAGHIMQEWARQEDMIIPDTMPLTQIMTTALERGGQDRNTIADHVLSYLDTDLLCYRTEMPDELARLQAEKWQPWLDWFAGQSGVMLDTTLTVTALTQPREAHDYLARRLEEADRWEFTALQMVTAATGSVILALAFLDNAADAEAVLAAAQLEEQYRSALYNEDFYGRDPHQEKIQTALLKDLQSLRLFLDAIRV